MTWTLVSVNDGVWTLKSDGIPYEDAYIEEQYWERYGGKPEYTKGKYQNIDSTLDNYTYKSRSIIGFTQEDIDKAVERGYTIYYPETPLGQAWLNTLTPEQKSAYMGYVNAEKAFKKDLYKAIELYDNRWKTELINVKKYPTVQPGKNWSWDSNTKTWKPQWGAHMFERQTLIDENIAAWHKANPKPDFRTPQQKITDEIKKTAKQAIGKLIPEVSTTISKVIGGVGIAGMALDSITFAVELSVFTMFIHEESLQIACRWLLNAMWPSPSLSQVDGVLGLEFEYQFAQAMNCYLNCWWLLVYCNSGYEAYFNAASICGDCARMLLGRSPQGITL